MPENIADYIDLKKGDIKFRGSVAKFVNMVFEAPKGDPWSRFKSRLGINQASGRRNRTGRMSINIINCSKIANSCRSDAGLSDQLSLFLNFTPKSQTSESFKGDTYNSFKVLKTPTEKEKANPNPTHFYTGGLIKHPELSEGLDFERELSQNHSRTISSRLKQPRQLPAMLLISGNEGEGKTTLMNRLAYPLIEQDGHVLELKAEFRIDVDEIEKYINRNNHEPVVLLIDELIESHYPTDFFFDQFMASYTTIRKRELPVFILATEQTLLWIRLYENPMKNYELTNLDVFELNHLRETEPKRLVSKLKNYEDQIESIKKYNADELMEKLERYDRQSLLVTMISLIHGRFDTYIKKEYDALSQEAKDIYRTVVYFQKLGKPIWKVFFHRMSSISPSALEELKYLLRETHERGQIVPRHRSIGRVILNHHVNSDNAKMKAVKPLLLNFADQHFITEFIKNHAQFLVNDLENPTEAIELFQTLEQLDYSDSSFMKLRLRMLLARCYEKLEIHTVARDHYVDAVQFVPQVQERTASFFYRQWAWFEKRIKKMGPAIQRAEEAISFNPKRYSNQTQILRLYLHHNVETIRKGLALIHDLQLDSQSQEQNDISNLTKAVIFVADQIGDAFPDTETSFNALGTSMGLDISNFNQFWKKSPDELMEHFLKALRNRFGSFSNIKHCKDHVWSSFIKTFEARSQYYSQGEWIQELNGEKWFNSKQMDIKKVERLYKDAIDEDSSNILARCYYATFLKDVCHEKRFAIDVLLKGKERMTENSKGGSLLLNNYALFLYQWQGDDKETLIEARNAVKLAIERMDDYPWREAHPRFHLREIESRMIDLGLL